MYQMPKHNMHVNLLFCTKAVLFVCENSGCWQSTRKASSTATNHPLPGVICWVSENHRRNLFRTIETKKTAPLYWEVFKFQPPSYIAVSCRTFYFFVYSKFVTLSATNSELLMKVQLSERQFLDRNHAERV